MQGKCKKMSLEEWQISVKDKSKYELVREGEKLSLKKYKIISKDKIDCTKKELCFQSSLCGRRDLNPYASNMHKILSLARLPVPTLPRISLYDFV